MTGELLTNPPPSAGGTLLAYSLALLDRGPSPPTLRSVIDAMAAAQSERTPEFVEGLDQDGFLERFLAARLGSTTHISVIDAEGRACSATCTNGEGSGVVVPGTGIHLNNVMGEEDLNPLGFHLHPAGRRMPSMMAPSVVMRDGEVELVLGSAGSNRIRSAILQTIVGVVDHGMAVRERWRRRGCTSRTASCSPSPGSSWVNSTHRRGSFASAPPTSSSAVCRPSSGSVRTSPARGTRAAAASRWRMRAALVLCALARRSSCVGGAASQPADLFW